MKAKEILSYSFSGLMLICMLLIVVFLIHLEFFTPTAQRPRPQTRQISNWSQLKLHGARTGPEDAPVQIVEFFDYQCPFCKQAQPAVEAIRKKYPQKVAVIHENFPLKMHQHAFGAAIAAECARRQGAFTGYHDGLFANQNKLGAASFYDSLATRTNVSNQTAFEKCVATQKTANIVNAGKTLGTKLGVSGIPTFLINGTLISGALPEPRLEELVKNKLASAE